MKVIIITTEPNGEVLDKETHEIDLKDLNFDPIYELNRMLCKDLTERSDKEIREYCNGSKHGIYSYTAFISEDIANYESSLLSKIRKIKRKINRFFRKIGGMMNSKKKKKGD